MTFLFHNCLDVLNIFTEVAIIFLLDFMSNKRLMEVFADVEVDTDQLEAFIKGQVSTDILLQALNSD